MGNRAYIKPIDSDIAVYLHWNGGIDSVTAFLSYCKLREFRDFGGQNSDGYGIARFCQVVGNYFGGELSLGIEHISDQYVKDIKDGKESSCCDNGIYIIDGWDIVERVDNPSGREGYDILEMLFEIDDMQPENDRIGKERIEEWFYNISAIV